MDLMEESRQRYHDAMRCMEDIERGLTALRALLQLGMEIYRAQRYKALFGPMDDLNKGLRQLRHETLGGYRYNANHRRCRDTNIKEHRLRTQLQLLFDAHAGLAAIFLADEVVETSVRHTVQHGAFPDVDKKIKNDMHFRHRLKHFPQIVETLGADYLKVPDLDQRAFVLKREGMEPVYVLGRSRLTTPALSAVTSLKPSVSKSEASRRAAREDEITERIRACECYRCRFLCHLEEYYCDKRWDEDYHEEIKACRASTAPLARDHLINRLQQLRRKQDLEEEEKRAPLNDQSRASLKSTGSTPRRPVYPVVVERSPMCEGGRRAGKMSAKQQLNKSMVVAPILKPSTTSKVSLSRATQSFGDKPSSARRSVRFEAMASPESSAIQEAEPVHIALPDSHGLSDS